MEIYTLAGDGTHRGRFQRLVLAERRQDAGQTACEHGLAGTGRADEEEVYGIIHPMTDAYAYVRFSTPEQELGDSRRRQTDVIEQFVAANNLTLQDGRRFHDEGVSSYRGDNLKHGLGKFIEEVDAGKISRGTYLIVESVDRLTRQSLFNAFGLLMSIVGKGIKLVTLNDGGTQIIDEGAGLTQFLTTLVAMDLAHKESQKKSIRVREAWRQKKAKAATVKVSVRCPEWLAFNRQTNQFEPIKERVASIQKIFELADEGIGRHRIVRYLNLNGYKSFRNERNGWQSSSVGKLLKNKSLIGYYQPASVEHDPDTGKEKRVPDGEIVPSYYPVVMDADLFRRVSSKSHTRALPLLGRQGPSLTNLFTGMTFCKWCGSPMSLSNKGTGPKGGRYLVCSNARRGQGCDYRSWRYEEFEAAVLVKLREIDLASVMGNTSLTKEFADARNSIATIIEELATCQTLLANFQSTADENGWDLPRAVLDRWKAEEAREVDLQKKLEALRAREQAIAQRVEDPAAFGEQLIKLYEAMGTLSEQERYRIRVRLRERLAIVIERIEVRALKKMEPRMVDGVPRDRLIQIKFRNGETRSIVPVGRSLFTLSVRGKVAAG